MIILGSFSTLDAFYSTPMTATDKQQKSTKRKPGRPRAKPVTEFGRWFEKFSKRSQVSASDIETAIGGCRTYVNELIKGKKVPSLVNAIKLIKLSRDKKLTTIHPEWFIPDIASQVKKNQ